VLTVFYTVCAVAFAAIEEVLISLNRHLMD